MAGRCSAGRVCPLLSLLAVLQRCEHQLRRQRWYLIHQLCSQKLAAVPLAALLSEGLPNLCCDKSVHQHHEFSPSATVTTTGDFLRPLLALLHGPWASSGVYLSEPPCTCILCFSCSLFAVPSKQGSPFSFLTCGFA